LPKENVAPGYNACGQMLALRHFYFQSVPRLACAFSFLSSPSQLTTFHCVKATLDTQVLGRFQKEQRRHFKTSVPVKVTATLILKTPEKWS